MKQIAYMLRGWILVACLLAGSTGIAQNDTLKILFVGNSFTYFNNLPQMVAAMGAAEGVPLFTRQSTVGGSNLEQHWKGEKGTKTMQLLESDDWDYVVLNNHSLSAINSPEDFMEYGQKFADKIKKLGAKPVFMMTWAYKSNPLMQAAISEKYFELSKATESAYVPCGPIFSQIREARPDMELFFDDKHPSATGTYALALAFFKFFSDQSVTGIPERLTTRDHFGEKLYLVFMSKEDASFLQQLVEEFDFNLDPIFKK